MAAEGGELGRRFTRWRRISGEPIVQPAVRLEQAPVRVMQLESPEARGVEDPEPAAAVLYAQRVIRDDGIEEVAVEGAGHHLVVADAA